MGRAFVQRGVRSKFRRPSLGNNYVDTQRDLVVQGKRHRYREANNGTGRSQRLKGIVDRLLSETVVYYSR